MALKIDGKKLIVKEVADVAANATSAIAAEYRGLTVSQMTELRTKARQDKIYLRVVRNTLARRAVDGTEFACLKEALVGPLILMFSQGDPGAAARLVRDFSKKFEKLQVKALAIGGHLLEPSKLVQLANLPTRDQAIALLMSVMLAPISKLARTMSETYAQVVRVTSAVAEKKRAD